MTPPLPLHSRFAIASSACAILFAALLIADEVCKRTSLPRVEQWPFIGTPLTFLPLPLLAATMIFGVTSAALRRHRSRTLAPSACVWCDYDRAGLADSAPCPECGRFPVPPPPPTA